MSGCCFGANEELPNISANDNRTPAGHLDSGVLTLHLELREVLWHPEAEDSRAIDVYCFAEVPHRFGRQKGIGAETVDGDVSLMVVGPSEVRVRSGAGTIDVGGARGTLVVSTDTGDRHAKAVPHDDWQLNSVSGTVRIELPPAAKFNLNATTDSGTFAIRRDDFQKPDDGVRNSTQRVNGGGKRIDVHTESGRIG